MQSKYRLMREVAYEQGRATFPELLLRPTFRDFVCLYVAEGYKRNRNCVALGNSDVRVILVADCWIRLYSSNPVTYSLQYHADQDLDATRTFWAEHLGIEPGVIRLQRKSNSGQLKGRKWRSVHGVLTISAGDTLFRARLQAWMDCLQQGWLDSLPLGV